MDSKNILKPLQYWIGEYLPNAEGKRPNTIKSYKDTWRLIIKYYGTQGIKADCISYDMLSYSQLMGFLSWVEKDRNCKVSTRNNRLAAISKFAKYSIIYDFDAASELTKAVANIPHKTTSDSTERVSFSQEEVKIFMDLPTPKGKMGIRDHTLLQFMYASGARADEVCIVKVKDVKFLADGKSSITLHGKGGKTRRIKIFEEPTSTLKKYIRYRRIENQPDSFVFPSQRNERMSIKCVEEIYKKYELLAKQKYPELFKAESYPPHSMRHTTATHMLEAGVPVIVIKQFLGHAHIATTEIYAKLSPDAVNAKLKDWNEKFWNDYIDQPMHPEHEYVGDDGVPDFLK